MSLLQVVLEEQSPAGILLIGFLARVITELHCNRSSSATIGLVNFAQSTKFDYVPSKLMQQVPAAMFVSIERGGKYSKLDSMNTPIVLHAFSSWDRTKASILRLAEAGEILDDFGLYGKEKKVIVLVDDNSIRSSELQILVRSYNYAGAIDVIYVLVNFASVKILSPNRLQYNLTTRHALRDPVEKLFPDRLSNLSGRPYRVLCHDNRPLSYLNDNQIVGIDVEFIDIIAKHQSTVAVYEIALKSKSFGELWRARRVDLATFRIELQGMEYPFTPIFFPNQFRWCLAVPKAYHRIIHKQMIWPYTPGLWGLILTVAVFFVTYELLLKKFLLKHFGDAFPIINTPLHILRILLLFLLTEYYTANLTAILGLSQFSDHPRTLEEFARSPIPLILSYPDKFQYVRDNPMVRAKTIDWNFSQTYDPTGLAMIQLCDLFPYTIDDTTSDLGKRYGHRHYHLIEEPIITSITASAFQRRSPLLIRFQMYISRLKEAGIWDYQMRKGIINNRNRWTKPQGAANDDELERLSRKQSTILRHEHFAPVFLLVGSVYLVAVIVFLLELAVHRIEQRFRWTGGGGMAWGNHTLD
uniref:Ionotropic glutamate receptor L-glutamate and glycine-binding domain-containing protein n=1 Tax=Anopheles atroparvus TaxID=41427 RepID=A0A182ILI6_ANOAO